ncbi:sulfotransferase domain-containing protein [Amaricoccus solimangrovi]|nr:sulfotransferase domain-containing protein [Amaricoccus solimangrovi]
MPNVAFFITTARSGTQWTASTLSRIYPDEVVVEHEPLGYRYAPRRNLRDIERLRELLSDDVIRQHFDRIHETIEHRTYVEVGFPAFALAPLLREEFGDRLRLAQLTRNPVQVAASTVTHDWFKEGERQEIKDLILLAPGEPGAALPHYADRWPGMSGFERGLYYWYQVHGFGLEQEALSPPGTFARFRFEDLMGDPEVQRSLAAFLGLPERDGWEEATKTRVDVHQRRTPQRFDVEAIARHPEIGALAHRLGYDPGGIDGKALDRRYRISRYRLMARELRRKYLSR